MAGKGKENDSDRMHGYIVYRISTGGDTSQFYKDCSQLLLVTLSLTNQYLHEMLLRGFGFATSHIGIECHVLSSTF